ncbi:VOC family protein [Peristeroidobacter soli]|uniref:VOC family protein n=1 Tax=Peristeroidobacter soli TaxID=2497877 RepID=UPI00101BF963|nr:VOC family protein [Peristeroidobacter soli]
MPRIEHVALWARDLDNLCSFYARAFGAAGGSLYENKAKGFKSRFLTFQSGARLEIMATSQLQPVEHEPGAQLMGLTHLAFSLGSEAAVDELTEKLRDAGASVLDGPRRTGDGYYESVVHDFLR